MIGLLPGFLLKFVGSGVLESFLSHQRKKMDSATEREKNQLNHQIKRGEHELKRRELVRDLQIRELEVWWIAAPKALLMWFVSIYLCALIAVSALDANDRWGIIVDDLPERGWWVVTIVVGYWFLDKGIKTWRKD